MSDKIRNLYRGDCLEILAEYIAPQSVDLIYLDPPFNSKTNYNLPFRHKDKNYKPVEAFKDIWTWTDDNTRRLREMESDTRTRRLASIVKFAQEMEQSPNSSRRTKSSLASYLIGMVDRLQACRRVLKETGSIYLHCDPAAGHYLKLLMDAIFGSPQFRNEIVWNYNKWTNAANYFQRNHDTLLFYSKDKKYTFNKQYWMTAHKQKVTERGWDSNKVEGGIRQLLVYNKELAADEISNPKYARVVYRDNKPEGTAISDTWSDIQYIASTAKERLGYPTQKPLALLERIIKASSNPR